MKNSFFLSLPRDRRRLVIDIDRRAVAHLVEDADVTTISRHFSIIDINILNTIHVFSNTDMTYSEFLTYSDLYQALSTIYVVVGSTVVVALGSQSKMSLKFELTRCYGRYEEGRIVAMAIGRAAAEAIGRALRRRRTPRRFRRF